MLINPLIPTRRALDRLRSPGSRTLDRLRSSLGGLTHALGEGHLFVTFGGVSVSVVLVFAVGLDESGEVLGGAGTGVGQRLGLATGGEELDGWETGDLVRDVVGGGVDFGDDNFGVGGVFGGELIVLGGKAVVCISGVLNDAREGKQSSRFAVATPWGVEL